MQQTGVISSLKAWAAQPFTESMDLTGWFLFTGLILIVAFFWTRVLNHVVA